MGISRSGGVKAAAILEVLLDHGDDLVLAQTTPGLHGVAKMKWRGQTLLHVGATNAAHELGKLEIALGVLAVVLIWHHEHTSATMTAGRARVTTTGRYISRGDRQCA